RDLLEARALDEGPVGRALVAQEDVAALAQRDQVLARDGLVRQDEVASGRRSEIDWLLPQVDRLAPIRPLDDEERAARPLPRERRRLVEEARDVGFSSGGTLGHSFARSRRAAPSTVPRRARGGQRYGRVKRSETVAPVATLTIVPGCPV